MPTFRNVGSISVVGAGVSGLTCGVVLAEAGLDVGIVTRDESPNTTSDVAAAVWFPYRAAPRDRVLAWAAASFDVFRRLPSETGVTMVDGVELFREATRPAPWWASAVTSVRRAESTELPPGYGSGWATRVPVIAMPSYLAWLKERFLAAGGAFTRGTVRDLGDVASAAAAGIAGAVGDAVGAVGGSAATVVNCTGLAAGALTGDDRLFPIRGQILRVEPGYATRFVQAVSEDGPPTYIIPRPDLTVLGGTSDVGAWDTEPSQEVADAILERCVRLEPRLAQAQVLSHAVGLRPGRDAVRLEAERVGGVTVVHNYGHGGSGVTVSWGCAFEVRELVLQEHS